MDFIELTLLEGKKSCLVIVCMFSRWVEVFPTFKQDAGMVAKILLREIIPRWGIPGLIGSDNGPGFHALVWVECKDRKMLLPHSIWLDISMSSKPDIERTPEPCTTSWGYKDCIVYDVWIISSGCSQRWEMLHPPSHAESSMQITPNYVGDKGEVVRFAVRTFNYKNRPRNANWVALFRLTYYKQYIQQGLRYQMQMTLADTNCKSESEWLNAACSFIPNAASIRY